MGHELLDSTSLLSAENRDSLVLYNSAASPCARRVRISLLEKGLEFDTVEMNLINMEQRSQDYLHLNPNGYVPTLSHGERVIYDSQAINEYLDETFPDRPLMPKTLDERAQVRSWLGAEETFANLFRPLLYQRVMGPIQHISRTLEESRMINQVCSEDPKDILWGDKIWQMSVLTCTEEWQQEQALIRWLDTLERALEHKTFLVGNYFTQADISLYPRVKMMSYLGLTLDPNRFANVIAWLNRLSRRTSFKDSMSEQGKKLEKLANSALLVKLRRLLKQPKSHLNFVDKSFIWGFGYLIRKIQKVDKTLNDIRLTHASSNPNCLVRDLPMPRKGMQGSSQVCVLKHDTSIQKKPLVDEKILLKADSQSIERHKIGLLLDQLSIKYDFKESNVKYKTPVRNHQNSNQINETPSLHITPDRQINHDVAIYEYLIERFDTQQCWMGVTSWQKAQVRMWLALERGTQKEFEPLWHKYIFTQSHQVIAAQDEDHYLSRIMQKCQVLEHQLMLTPYLNGAKVCLADLVWYSRLYYLHKIPGFSLSNFDALTAWYKGLDSQFGLLGDQIVSA
jgi:glutathione S-transferase